MYNFNYTFVHANRGTQKLADMKTHTIKNYCGSKHLIVNDLANADVLALYKEAVSKGLPFAVKQEIGIQIWGLFNVADYLGIKDCSKVLND